MGDVGEVNVGWIFDKERPSKIPYGYNCPSQTRIPDICDEVAEKAYYAHADAEEKNDDGIDLLGGGQTDLKTMIPGISSKGLYSLYSSYSHYIIVGIMIIFMLNVVICGYVKCKKSKNTKNGGVSGRYGKVGKDVESEDSDGTDTEFDSDDSSIEQLIE